MSALPNVVAPVVSVVKAPFNWAQARPFAFILMVLVIAVLAIKFAPTILRWIGKAPGVGGRVVAFAQPRAAGA